VPETLVSGVKQRGAVLILVLWFVAIATLLVGVLAHQVRLSALSVVQHRQTADHWGLVLQALRVAEMELMIARMPPSPEISKIPLSERQDPLLQFDGRVLQTAYPLPENVILRIYDHAGMLNLQRINVQQMRDILSKRAGDDPAKLDALYDIWLDWRDADDLKRLNGAEKDYYKKLKPAYEPRNGNLETVDELRLLKDYETLFDGINLDFAFTVYGTLPGVNPNLANAETLALLPGMDEAGIAEILARRQEKAFKTIQDFAEFLTPEQLTQIGRWVNFGASNFYSIAIEIKRDAAPATDSGESGAKEKEAAPGGQAFLAMVMVRGPAQPSKILMIKPYAKLP
jgi:general secretion pathway protein K